MNIRFVLVETSHPGNIGAAARAIRTMGFLDLVLVNPLAYPDPQVNALASHATDVLDRIQVFPTLHAAIAQSDCVVGTSARSRTLPWKMIDPKGLRALLDGQSVPNSVEEGRPFLAHTHPSQIHELSIVFGREDRGLSNDELAMCHYHLQIPTSDSYMSLNLAQAVQVVAYELFGCGPLDQALVLQESTPRATVEQLQGFYEHLEQALTHVGYLDSRRPKKLMERLQRVFQRTELEQDEVDLLRGIFTRMQQLDPPMLTKYDRQAIYLDYAASTPLDREVFAAMKPWMNGPEHFGNPSSLHVYGARAQAAIERASQQLADAMGATSDEIIWTSGATEANNLALRGIAEAYAFKGRHLVTCKTEHKSVLEVLEHLASTGFEISYLNVDRQGRIDLDEFKSVLRPDTIAVSVMWVNNETGVIQPIEEVISLAHERGVLVHVDAVQALLTQEIDVRRYGMDVLSLSGHKVYGPKGVGALYVRKKPRVRLTPLLLGGGQQKRLRPGTIPTHQVVGMGEAVARAVSSRKAHIAHFWMLKQHLISMLARHYPGEYQINGPVELEKASPHILNVCFLTMDSEWIKHSLSELCLAQGSACNSTAILPSHVLSAMKLTSLEADRSFRISWGIDTTTAELTRLVHRVSDLYREKMMSSSNAEVHQVK